MELVTDQPTRSRKRWSPENKVRIVEESYGVQNSVSETARKYGISPAMVYQWRQWMKAGATEGVKNKAEIISKAEYKKLQEENRRLMKLLGKKDLTIDILETAISLGKEKKLFSPAELSRMERLGIK